MLAAHSSVHTRANREEQGLRPEERKSDAYRLAEKEKERGDSAEKIRNSKQNPKLKQK